LESGREDLGLRLGRWGDVHAIDAVARGSLAERSRRAVRPLSQI
jgi:hypothetical protein